MCLAYVDRNPRRDVLRGWKVGRIEGDFFITSITSTRLEFGVRITDRYTGQILARTPLGDIEMYNTGFHFY